MYYRVYDLKSNEMPEISNIEYNEAFITCLSYEERSLGIIQFFNNSTRFKVGIFFVNKDIEDLEPVKNKISLIKSNFSKYFEEIKIISIPKDHDCQKNGIFIINAITSIFGKLNVEAISINITTFKRYQLIFLIYSLDNLKKKYRFFYISPVKYGDWQSEHYNESSSLALFVNNHFDSRKKNMLLIILGFEVNRAIRLIDDFKPEKVIIGRTNPPTSENHLMIQNTKIQEELNYVINNFSNKEILDFHGYDVKILINQINEIIEEYFNDYNIFISIMGPKCQLLSFYPIYKRKKNLNFYYNTASIYNYENYTQGIHKIYEYYFNKNFNLEEIS